MLNHGLVKNVRQVFLITKCKSKILSDRLLTLNSHMSIIVNPIIVDIATSGGGGRGGSLGCCCSSVGGGVRCFETLVFAATANRNIAESATFSPVPLTGLAKVSRL